MELSVIEDMERFHADVQRLGFRKTDRLAQLQVEVLDAGTLKEAAGRVAKLSQRFRNQNAGVKYRLAVAKSLVEIERAGRA